MTWSDSFARSAGHSPAVSLLCSAREPSCDPACAAPPAAVPSGRRGRCCAPRGARTGSPMADRIGAQHLHGVGPTSGGGSRRCSSPRRLGSWLSGPTWPAAGCGDRGGRLARGRPGASGGGCRTAHPLVGDQLPAGAVDQRAEHPVGVPMNRISAGLQAAAQSCLRSWSSARSSARTLARISRSSWPGATSTA
jgi:hypothetical protein